MADHGLYGNITNRSNATSHSSGDLGNASVEIGFKCTAYVVVVVVSLVGNSLIIAAFKLNVNGKLRTVNNTFIVSLASADILLTLGSIPERITRIIVHDVWLVSGSLGVFLCKTANYVEKLCIIVSIFHLAMIAVDRFLAVFYPRKKIITIRKSRLIAGIAWITAAAYCVPLFYHANLLAEKGRVLCKTRRFFTNWRIWYLFYLAMLVLTLIFVVALYTAMIIRLWRLKAPGGKISFRNRLTARRNSRVLKMVAVIVLVFYVCFLPYWIGWVTCSYFRSDVICTKTYAFISIYLSYANSALNPIIYAFFNEHFRVGFKFIHSKLCKCCVSQRKLNIQRKMQMKMCESYVVATDLDGMKESNFHVRCQNVKNIESCGKQV